MGLDPGLGVSIRSGVCAAHRWSILLLVRCDASGAPRAHPTEPPGSRPDRLRPWRSPGCAGGSTCPRRWRWWSPASGPRSCRASWPVQFDPDTVVLHRGAHPAAVLGRAGVVLPGHPGQPAADRAARDRAAGVHRAWPSGSSRGGWCRGCRCPRRSCSAPSSHRPDAVSALAVGRSLGLPRRLMTILGGESLVNDATALTLFRVFVAVAAGTAISPLEAVGMFVLAAVGGTVIGYAIGWVVHRIRRRLDDSERRERARADRAVRGVPGRGGAAHLRRARRRRRGDLPGPPRPGERLRHPAAGAGGVAGQRHHPGVGRVRADRAAADHRRRGRRATSSRCWSPARS